MINASTAPPIAGPALTVHTVTSATTELISAATIPAYHAKRIAVSAIIHRVVWVVSSGTTIATAAANYAVQGVLGVLATILALVATMAIFSKIIHVRIARITVLFVPTTLPVIPVSLAIS